MVISTEYNTLELYHVNYNKIHDKGVLTGQVGDFFETKYTSGEHEGEYMYETCCAQISYAFNKAGPMIQNSGILPLDRILTDKAGMEYILSVPEMKIYLTRRFFPPEKFAGMGGAQNLKMQIGKRKGILAFGDRHIDLWNGNNFQYGGTGLYLENVLWKDKRNTPRIISFWEVKTFLAVLEDLYQF